MATITAFPSLHSSIYRFNFVPSSSSSPPSLSFSHFQPRKVTQIPSLTIKGRFPFRIRAVTEEEEGTLIPEAEGEEAPVTDQPVSVPVSPSDILTMFFQAEGVMDESGVSKVTKALDEIEGISDLRVRVLEGIASVELKKETTVQATGVASNLVEVIQGTGFKLQSLNLSFEDEEDAS